MGCWELFISGWSMYQVLHNQPILLWITTGCLQGLLLVIEHGTRSYIHVCTHQQSCQWRILVDHQQWLYQGRWGHEKEKIVVIFWKRVNFQGVENREHICMAGRSRVTVECFSSVFSMTNGPSKWGINLVTQFGSPALSLWCQCTVDSTTQSLILKGKARVHDLLAWNTWETFANIKLSCSSETMLCILFTRSAASLLTGVLVEDEKRGRRMQGDQPH